ncbi:MAG: serine protease [Xenococcus sp. (in: cyanobacteria)]
MSWSIKLFVTIAIAFSWEIFSAKYLASLNYPMWASENSSYLKQISNAHNGKAILSLEQIQQKAQSITVKVISGPTWGSGMIIEKQENVYTVVTNNHVLIFSNDQTYRIQTPDGQIYQANLLETIDFQDNDLGLLQFRSEQEYEVISLTPVSSLTQGEEVFAAGFPIEIGEQEQKEFYFIDGNIAHYSQNSFGGGYQIGYTNNVKKGMSGGPLLNLRGEVIAINGMHKYPLWGNPYIFSDGSRASEGKKEEMSKFSWAIPVNTLLQIAPQFSTKKVK